MLVSGLSKKALDFGIGYCLNLPRAIEEAKGVMIRVIEIDNRVHVMLDVGEEATFDGIVKGATLALQWRDKLLEWQGPNYNGGPDYLLLTLDNKNDMGVTYKDLANEINQEIVYLLKEKTEYFLFHAQYLLKCLRFKDKEITSFLSEGLEDIDNGYLPYSNKPEYPVTARKVESVLRSWRDNKTKLRDRKNKIRKTP